MNEWNPRRPQVPVDKNGNWMAYPDWRFTGWETIHQPFYAVMEIDGMETGRSAKRVILKNVDTGQKYPMFVADLVGGIKEGAFIVTVGQLQSSGKISGWWTACKRGANYGIKAVSQ